tara:strand:+ start:25384 stop:25809 length:426 start_codon:yes stop_codon:yes gene_type:complete
LGGGAGSGIVGGEPEGVTLGGRVGSGIVGGGGGNGRFGGSVGSGMFGGGAGGGIANEGMLRLGVILFSEARASDRNAPVLGLGCKLGTSSVGGFDVRLPGMKDGVEAMARTGRAEDRRNGAGVFRAWKDVGRRGCVAEVAD